MCMLCAEIQKKSMTIREVARTYREFTIPEGHAKELMTEMEKVYDVEKIADELNELYEKELTKGIP